MREILSVICCCAMGLLLTACGGGGSSGGNSDASVSNVGTGTATPTVSTPTTSASTTAVTIFSPMASLINSIDAAPLNFTSPSGTKSVVIDGVATTIGAGLVFANLREDLSLQAAEQLFQKLADWGVEVAGVMRGNLTVQLKVPAILTEIELVDKLEALPAIAIAWPITGVSGSGGAVSPAGLATTSEWWRLATHSREAFDFLQKNLKRTNNKQTMLAMLDEQPYGTTNHATGVKSFLAGSATMPYQIEGMYPKAAVSEYLIDSLAGLTYRLGYDNQFEGGLNRAVDAGAKVINMSLGLATFDSYRLLSNETKLRSTSMLSPLRMCQINDCLILKASGNDGLKNDDQLFTSKVDTVVSRMRWLDHAMIIGATNATGKDATFSRMGKTVDLLAPGDNVGYYDLGVTSIYVGGAGTSFSTPIVSGVASMVRTIAPSLRAAEVKKVLLSSANPILDFQTVSELKADKRYKRDYVQATHPNIQLDAKRAVESAEALESISKTTAKTVTLALGQTEKLNITVTRNAVNKLVDVVFLFDVSGSTEKQRLIFQTTSNSIVSTIKSAYASAAFGIATFSDYPDAYDRPSDKPFEILRPITADVSALTATISGLSAIRQNGGDTPESQLDAIYQLATGKGRDTNNDGKYTGLQDIPLNSIGWRTGAKRIVILFTDAAYSDRDLDYSYLGMSKSEAVNAVKENGLSVFALLPESNYDDTYGDYGLPVYQRLTSEMGGTAEVIGTSTTKITQSIRQAVDSTFDKLATISLEAVGGAVQIEKIVPVSQIVAPGGVANFTVTIKGVIPEDIAKKDGASIFPITLWANEKSSSGVGVTGQTVLQRHEIPVAVPAGAAKLQSTTSEPLKRFLNKWLL